MELIISRYGDTTRNNIVKCDEKGNVFSGGSCTLFWICADSFSGTGEITGGCGENRYVFQCIAQGYNSTTGSKN